MLESESIDVALTGSVYEMLRLQSDSVWYASYNEDGARRCFKDLKEHHQIGWTSKDQIKVMVDLDRYRIKFYRNGQRVWHRLLCFFSCVLSAVLANRCAIAL